MKVLVTGAAGFIGSHVVDILIEHGYKKVYSVDDLSGGFKHNLNKKSQFIKLDLRKTKDVENLIKKIKPELIFHLAADAAEGRSQFMPISCTQRNYAAYLNLLTPAIKYGLKKIVLVSSMSVYGAQTPPFSEDMEPKPEDVYAMNKFAMEKSTEVLSKVFGFEYTIIRPHNVYGPKQNFSDPYRNVVAIFINSILNNKNFYIYGKGNQKRGFTYIDDCAPYIVKAGFLDKANGEIFNIGPKEHYSINELADVILKCFFGDNIPPRFNPKYLDLRPQEVIEAYCTEDKSKKILGYETTVTLEEGISRTISWIKPLGAQKPIYVKELELGGDKLPLTWKKKLI